MKYMMWYWGYPYMGFWGWIIPVLFWVVIIAIFASIMRGGHGRRWHHYYENGRGGRSEGRDPLDILKERYAKGDISEEQYARMRKEIEK